MKNNPLLKKLCKKAYRMGTNAALDGIITTENQKLNSILDWLWSASLIEPEWCLTIQRNFDLGHTASMSKLSAYRSV